MPTQAKLIAVLVSVALLLGGAGLAYQRGYAHGYGTAKTQGDAALLSWQNAQAAATAEARRRAGIQYAAQVQRADQAEQSLIDARRQLAQQTQQAKEQIDAVTQTYRRAPGAALQPLPQCVFTRSFVRLWNHQAGADGLSGAVPASTSTAGADATTGTDDALDSGVSQADILDWFTDYAERARNLETQLNTLLDVQLANQAAQP